MNDHQPTPRAVSLAGDHPTAHSPRGGDPGGGPANAGRRNFLVRVIAGIHAAMGATLAFIVGGAVLAPSFRRPGESWLHAAALDAVRENEPLAVTLRVARQDGSSQVVDRKVIYLVRHGDEVRAMGSTCTHLGCRTSYDRANKRIICPCHGGAYDLEGKVVSGPPPAPLPSVATRIDGDRVLVQV